MRLSDRLRRVVLLPCACLPWLLSCSSDSSGGSSAATNPEPALVPIEKIAFHDPIFGPDIVEVTVELSEGEFLQRAEVQDDFGPLRLAARVVVTGDTAMIEVPVDCCGSVSDFPARTEKLLIDVEFESGGDFFFAYLGSSGEIVREPVTVLPLSTITNIRLDPPSPAKLEYSESVEVTVSYSTPVPGGVMVFNDIMPDFQNRLTCASDVYPIGKGEATQCFTIFNAGEIEQIVTELTIEMVSAENRDRLAATRTIEVDYSFSNFGELPAPVLLSPNALPHSAGLFALLNGISFMHSSSASARR